MPHPPRRLQLGELADRRQRIIEAAAGHRLAERRLSVDDQVPAGRVVKAAEQHRRPAAEDLHQLRVELGAAAFPRHGHRRASSSAPAKNLHDVGQVDQARGDDDLGAFEPEGALTVPPFVALPQRLAHARAQTQPLSELVGGQVVVLGKSRERPAPVTQETQGDPGSFAQRPPRAADVLQQEGGGRPGPPQVVAVVRVALGPQVIAEPLGLLIGIGVAAHPRQQSRVVQDAALRLLQTQVISQPQRQQAGPHHVLHRLTQTKVRTQRQQSNQLGQTQVTTLPRCHMPTVPAAALAPDGTAGCRIGRGSTGSQPCRHGLAVMRARMQGKGRRAAARMAVRARAVRRRVRRALCPVAAPGAAFPAWPGWCGRGSG